MSRAFLVDVLHYTQKENSHSTNQSHDPVEPARGATTTRSTGYDHIDLACAAEREIAVANVPGYGENAVAEYTFALLLTLTLTRKIHMAATRTQHGDYTLEGLRGADLYGKTLGVIGTGAIGMYVIRIAKGFGMQVLAYDVFPQRHFAEVLGRWD